MSPEHTDDNVVPFAAMEKVAEPAEPQPQERHHALLIPMTALRKIIEMAVLEGYQSRNELAAFIPCTHCHKPVDRRVDVLAAEIIPCADRVFAAVLERIEPMGTPPPEIEQPQPSRRTLLYGPDGMTPVATT